MFRKIAIALVATSVLAAPVLAQGTTSGDSKTTTPPTVNIEPKSEKAITKVTKHHTVLRHHRHGAKLAKSTKSHTPKTAKFAKYGKYTHPMKHGKTASKLSGSKLSASKSMSSARASAKPISSKSLTKRSSSKSQRGLQ